MRGCKMKWKVTTQTGTTYAVEIPDLLKGALPALGEPFALHCHLDGEDSEQISVQCQFVADGKSLLIGNSIIRLASKPERLKKSKIRLRASCTSIVRDRTLAVKPVRPVEPMLTAAALGGGTIRAPMTGKVLKVVVQNGQSVAEGDVLVIIEAMKMENQIRAECAGRIDGVRVKEGDSITVDTALLELNPVQENHS